MEKEVKVLAQKVDPDAVIVKGNGSFATTILVSCEDGSERKHRVSTTRKKDLVKRLERLPIENVKGMSVSSEGWYTMELFAYNGV